MKSKTALILLCALCAASTLSAQAARKKAVVSTVDQLLKSIAPNMEIVLKPGVYALGAGQRITSKYVSWNREGGPSGLVIKDVKNLVIKGQDTEAASSIQTDDEGAFVLSFRSSSGVAIESVNVGHSVPGPCQAGVVSLSECSGFSFKDCLLSGSGSVGIEAEGCAGLSFENVTISECSLNGISMSEVEGATFDGCAFRGNGAYPLVYASRCSGLVFNKCGFGGNEGDTVVQGEAGAAGDGEPDGGIAFADCSFSENAIGVFGDPGFALYLNDCVFERNDFPDPQYYGNGDGEGEYSEGYSGDGGYGYYVHDASGLGISYPEYWEMQEDGEMAGFMSSEEGAAAALFPIGNVNKNVDPSKSPDKAFAPALDAIARTLREEMGLEVKAKAAGSVSGPEYLPHRDYEGTASSEEATLSIRARVFATEGRLWALLIMSDGPEAIGEDSEAGRILEGADLAPRGE